MTWLPCSRGAHLALALGLASGACASSEGAHGAPDHRMGRAALVLANPTGDTWDLRVDGVVRGSVAPHSDAHVTGLPEGEVEVVATNAVLDLVQRGRVALVANSEARFELRPLWATLVVHNAHSVAVEISVDGVVAGRVDANATARFERVPSGRRMILARVVGAPGAVRAKTTLAPEAEAAWDVPALETTNPIASEAPRLPAGQGLVWMQNAGRHVVRVTSGGVEFGRVAPGARLAIVLAPGTHVLRADIEGLEAHTEEAVTLAPNQIAEWVWSE